jgi:metallo-beta-lactamase family protein
MGKRSMIAVRAKVKTIDGFSAHADQREILCWLTGFKKVPLKTFVVHGEPVASEALGSLLREKSKWRTEVPKNGEAVVLS